MELNLNPQHVTKKEFDLVTRLQKAADPTERLFSNYYQIRKQVLFKEYENDLQHADVRIIESLRKDFLQQLDDLRKEYETDLKTWLELRLTMYNCFLPSGMF